MKPYLFLLAVFILVAPVEAKDILLTAEEKDADTLADALVLQAPGVYPITMKITNNRGTTGSGGMVDVFFVLDASGSMGREMQAVKDAIGRISVEIQDKCKVSLGPECFRAGIYVLEGRTRSRSTTNFMPARSYHPLNWTNDVGELDFTSDLDFLKRNQDQVFSAGSKEPWMSVTHHALLADEISWRDNATPVIIVVTDEEEQSNATDISESIRIINDRNGYFFAIIGKSGSSNKAEATARDIVSQTRGAVYDYDRPDEVTQRILDAINLVIANDTVILNKESGPDWDNLDSNFEIANVPRGGMFSHTIVITAPPMNKPEEVLLYKASFKDTQIGDVAYVRILGNTAPVADFTAIPKSGIAPLLVDFDAGASYDAEDNILDYQWDFGDGGKNTEKDPFIEHTYTGAGPFDATLTVTDELGLKDSITKQVIPYAAESVIDINAHNTKLDQPVSIGFICTKNLPVKIKVWEVEGGVPVYSAPDIEATITCNDPAIEYPPLPNPGNYMITAELDIPPNRCSRCSRNQFISVFESGELGVSSVPDLPPIMVVVLLIVVLALLSKTSPAGK